MFGAEAFPKLATGTDLVPVSSRMLTTTDNVATVEPMSPMDTIREVFFDIRDSLQKIVENTLQTNELLKVGVLGTPDEQRDESIDRGETDTDVPPPKEDSGPSFLDRLKGLNPFQGGIGTFGKVLLALAGLLGLKLFGPQIQGGLASLLTAIADGNLGEKIKEISTLVKTKIVDAIENLKTGTESFLNGLNTAFILVSSIAKVIGDYMMEFDTGGAGPGGMYPDGKLDEGELANMFKDLKEKIVTPIVDKIYGIAAIAGTAILSGLGLIKVADILSRLNPLALPPTGDSDKNKKKKSKLSKFFKVAGLSKFGVLALGGIIIAGLLSFASDAAFAIDEAMSLPDKDEIEKGLDEAMGNKEQGFVNKLLSAFIVGEETGNKITDVLKNGFNKGLMGAALGTASFIPFGTLAGFIGGAIFGGLSAYFGEEKVSNALELMFGDDTLFGKTMDYLYNTYELLLLKPFEFLFGKMGVANDSLLSRLGYRFDREGPMTDEQLYPDAFGLEDKTTGDLLQQRSEAMSELSQQPQNKSIFGFYPFGKYRDTHITRDLELQIDNIDRILQSRGSSDVNSQSNLPFLQMGSIEPKLEPLMRDVFTLREAAQRDMLVKDLDNMIIGSGNTTTSNVSNVNNFPGGFSPDNDFITAVIMGDKRAKMN